MFGFSFGEFVMICVVALVFVGPQKLPGLLRTLGQWIRKARSMVYDMRAQSGIDDILRAEGFNGGLNEVRSLLRGHGGGLSSLGSNEPHFEPPPNPAPDEAPPSPYVDPAFGAIDIDATREYPPEGADAYGALPDDLLDELEPVAATPAAPAAPAADPAATSPVTDPAGTAATAPTPSP